MPTPKLSEQQYLEVAELIAKHNGSVTEAGKVAQKALGISSTTFKSRAERGHALGFWGRSENNQSEVWVKQDRPSKPKTPFAGVLPEDDIPVTEIIDIMCKRYTKRKQNADAKKWRKFTVPVSGPYALMIFGDPHIDDNGCDWVTLRDHCNLAANTEALYAVNIGDTTNNWCGRLARLWAEQDTSASTARKLVQWFLADSGVPWWLWIAGNHDAWMGPVGIDALERFKPHHVMMEDWGAKVTLVSKNGFEMRIHAAHNFSGHSQWNPLHGPQKEAMWGDPAHLYVAGHHHNWALFHGEHQHKNSSYWLARARGYKMIDEYATRLGFGSQQYGQSILVVVDPDINDVGQVTCFADPVEGVEYLKWKRSR